MGRSYTPKYVVIINDEIRNPMEWKYRGNGRPSRENLRKYVEAYGASLNTGGVNAHIRNADGTIPYPRRARIQENTGPSGISVAQWQAPMFMVW